jgi:hypothetical protein
MTHPPNRILQSHQFLALTCYALTFDWLCSWTDAVTINPKVLKVFTPLISSPPRYRLRAALLAFITATS